MNFNRVIIGGTLTRDPEVRYSPNGKGIAKMCVAINSQWKSESGEAKKEVSFIDVKAFGNTAETVAKYFKKGSRILVEGKLKQETWEDKTTQQKRSQLVVLMEKFEFVDKKGEQAGSATQPATDHTTAAAGGKAEDDVPF